MAAGICKSLFFISVFVMFDLACNINIDFDDSKDGFFLKSTYHKFKPSEPNIVKESLILTHPAEVYKLRASYGPFEMYQSVPNNVLSSVVQYGEDVWDKSASSMHRQIIHNMDVSAHLVGRSRVVRHSNPFLQLLVHARPLVRRQKQRLIYSYYGYSQRWCARMFVSRGDEQYTSACVLEEDTNACAAGMDLPDHWWDHELKPHGGKDDSSSSTAAPASKEILVFYDLSGVEQNQECASVSNTIVPALGLQDSAEKKFITAVKLVHDDRPTFAKHNTSKLSFHVPDAHLAPGVKFEVPVFLLKHSPRENFFIQVSVRGNVAIEGASTNMNSAWMVFFEAGDNDHVATVSVVAKENAEDRENDNLEEIMRWQLRTTPGASDSLKIPRITWTVDYDKDLLGKPEEISVKFNVLPSYTEQIIPVLKERSLLNTAILSGKPVTHELNVYSVAQDNTVRDITKYSQCRSLKPHVVKVTNPCREIFLDGSETQGSKNVTVVVKSGGHEALLSIRVWVPEPRLDIQLSDPKLSQVRRWKVPDRGFQRSRFIRSPEPFSSNLSPSWPSDQSRLGGDITMGNRSKSCTLKYQQSQFEVYARFMISTVGQGTEYYRSKKTLVRVTSIVMPYIRTANPAVAKIYGQTVLGVSPGRTSVQVISPTTRVLGSKEIRVAKDKVDIERLMVRVISGIRIHIDKMMNLPGALLATVYLQDQLVAKQQEAVLDIALEFKDGTMLPLSSIDPEEYDLQVTSVNNNIVEVMETITTAASNPPSIKAIGDGKGEIIKVTLKEKDACERKKPRTLDTEYVHVQVDFAKDNDLYNWVQSDGHPLDRKSYQHNQKPYSTKEEFFKYHREQDNPPNTDYNKLDKVHHVDNSPDFVTAVTSVEEPDITKESRAEALEQPVSTKAKHPTPLEVAMYVLVAVFVFAILVFTANCAVFMVRHQRKCKPHSSKGLPSSKIKAGSISQAPDWVWIGRATLERQGAGNAGVDHALMAEEDFNGNQMVLPNNSISGSSRHSSTRKSAANERLISRSLSSSSGGCPASSASLGSNSGSNRNSMVSTYQGSECSIRITANPLLAAEGEIEPPCADGDGGDLGGMGYNEAEWDYEAMGMTYEQLMDYFDNLKESSA